jgi:uncharacterized membrane protein
VLVDWVDMRLRFPWAILALALTLAPFSAPLLAASHPLAALLIRDFFSQLCHQDPSRSFVVAGSAVAVCVRCLGIYWGVAVGMVVRWRRPRWLLALALVVNLADVGGGAMHWHGNLPVLRFLFGLMLGLGVGAVLSLWAVRLSTEQPVLTPTTNRHSESL